MRGSMFVLSLIFALFANAAIAANWIVERTTTDVTISEDGKSWRAVSNGTVVPNAHWIRTGPRARVLLSKGAERILYRANTLAAISVSLPKGQKTRVTQRTGSILLAVKKRRTQHTSVVTPHLAAVVKGTVFEVSVSKSKSDVRVDRGLVEVSSGDETVDVPRGKKAAAGQIGSGVSISEAEETSLTSTGLVGLELAAIKSNNNAGGIGNGNSNAGGNGNGNAGGNGNSNAGGNGNGNAGGNGNGNAGGNGNGN